MLLSVVVLLLLLFFAFLFYLLFSLSLMLIIGIFYCLNYTFLLLHLIITQLVSHLSLSSIVFIISMLIISIFYCLNCTSLLLHLFIRHLAIDFIITMELPYVLRNHYGLYKYHQVCSDLEKDHSMIETCHLKNVVIFIQTISSFALSRKMLQYFL